MALFARRKGGEGQRWEGRRVQVGGNEGEEAKITTGICVETGN